MPSMTATVRADDVVTRLLTALPAGEVIVDPDILASYTRDQAGLCEAHLPLAMVQAKSIDSVVTTLQLANATGTPVVPRGAGTGLSGGANATAGCIVLSVARMDRILDLDVAGRLARVEPGVLNGVLDAAAREHGLMYAPDPASRDISSIGGNVATNAGGACCLKYGVTGDHVARLKAVLADGSIIETGALTMKNVAGLDLNRLLIGSEGTLAVIVEITVRLLPRRPARGTLLAFFPTLIAAGEAVVALEATRALSKLEIMDQVTVRAVEELVHMELDTSAAALVLAQVDTADADAVLAASEAICTKHGATLSTTTTDENEGKQLMAARSAALPALEKKGHCLLDDVAVPVRAIPALLQLCNDVAARHGVVVGTFGHAGDGNLHPTLVYDGHNPVSTAAARAAFNDILHGALDLGGTVTGEHGVGLLKREQLEAMIGERELSLMHGIKKVFDPAGILNPGKGY